VTAPTPGKQPATPIAVVAVRIIWRVIGQSTKCWRCQSQSGWAVRVTSDRSGTLEVLAAVSVNTCSSTVGGWQPQLTRANKRTSAELSRSEDHRPFNTQRSIHQRDRCWASTGSHGVAETPAAEEATNRKDCAMCARDARPRRLSYASASTRCHRTSVSSRGFEPALTGYWRLAFEPVLLNHIVHDDLINGCPEVEVFLLCRCLFDGHWGISEPTCASSHDDVTSHVKYAEAFKFATAIVTLALHI
jgi:hypothetical protein